MSEPAGKGPGVKTLGIRLPDDLHAQFVLVAQLDGISLTDAIRRAIETYVAAKQSEPNFRARVTAALEEIEREAKWPEERHPSAAGASCTGSQRDAGHQGDRSVATREGLQLFALIHGRAHRWRDSNGWEDGRLRAPPPPTPQIKEILSF